jgi:hypothetical protein
MTSLRPFRSEDVDGRDKPGHDESRRFSDLNFKQPRD